MVHIGAARMTDALQKYDAWMIESLLKVSSTALGIAVWSDVLKELDHRGKVRLINGSYDDIGNALIHRIEGAETPAREH